MFTTLARYALVLAFALGFFHFNGASARAEKCNTAAADDIGSLFSPASLSGAPQLLRGNTPDKRIGSGASFVRFSVRSYFTMSGSPVTYSAVSYSPGVASVDDEMCGSMLKVTARSAGMATIRVTAEANGVSQTHTLTVEVDPNASFVESANRSPEAVGTIPDKTFTRATSPISFVVSPFFSDPDGNDLTYTAGLARAGVVDTSITDSTLTLTAVSRDTVTVAVTATDPGGLKATQSFLATVGNTEPEFIPFPGATIAVGDSLVIDLSDYFTDPDPEDELSYDNLLSYDSYDNVEVTGPGNTSTITIHGRAVGQATILMVAFDGHGGDTLGDFTVTVVPAGENRPPVPVGTIPDTTLTLGGSSVSLDVSEYFTDPDPQDTLSYTVSGPSIVTTSIPAGDNTLTITPVSAGTGTVAVTATDHPGGLSSPAQEFAVTVSSTQPPLSVSIVSGPTTMIDSGAENTWEAEASGGTSPYTYSWDYATECLAVPIRTDVSCLWQWISAGTGSTFTRTITTAGDSAAVRVTATDNLMPTPSSAESSVIVSVNHAPDTVGTIADRTIVLGQPDVSFSVAPYFSDPDPNDVLTYSASSSNTGNVGVSVSNGTLLTLTAEAVNTTPDTVTVTATDNRGLSATQKFPVTVEDPLSDLTAFITGDNLTSIESGTEYTWGATVTGGTRPYTYSWHYATRCENNSLLRDEPCTLQWTSAGSDSSYTRTITTMSDRAHIRLIVSDSATPADSVTKSIQLAVTQPTTITPPQTELVAVGTISNRTLTVGGSSSSFSVSSYFRKPNADDVLTYSASSSPSGIVSTSFSGVTLTVRPVAAGTAEITVTASLNGQSAEQRFDVTVNSEPEVDDHIPDQTLTAGDSAVTFDLDDYFSDPDNDDLDYEARSSNSTVARASVSSGSRLTITPLVQGSATVTVTADDGEDDVSQTVTVTVNRATEPIPNRGPIAEGTISKRELLLVTSPSESFSITSYFSDPNPNDVLTYSALSDDTGIVTASIPQGGSMLTITAASQGTATITVTASDGEYSATQEFDVDVPNRSPVAEGTISKRELLLVTSPSESFSITSYFSDPDPNDILTYSALSDDTGIVTASMSGSSLTITAVSQGTATITVRATDPGGLYTTQQFTAEVPNRSPVVTSDIPDQTLKEDGLSVTFNLDSYFSDPDDDDLTYTATVGPIGPAGASISGSTLTIRPVWVGYTTVTVTAKDPSNASVSQFVAVTVTVASGLTASISGPSSVNSLGSNTWTASVSGGTTPYTYSWRYSRLCSNSNQVPPDRAAPPCREWISAGTASSLTLTLSESTTIELTVTDDDNYSVTPTLGVSFSNLDL